MDCVPGACTAPPETCNGADDDCDGTADDGFACEAGSSSPCMTSCGSVGSAPCQADCTRGACRPPPETCGNGVDEDCDSMVDEGCMAGCTGTCADAVEVALPGARATAMPSADTASGSCGGAGGADARFTFTITTRSDVFVTTHGSGLDTVVYVRGCACDGTEVGCNDDADGQTSSALSLVDLPGGTYTVFVDTKAAMSVSVSVDILVTPTGQEGDRCGRPLPLVGPTVAGNTCGLTSDNSGPCEYVGSLDGPDRVYYLVVTSTRSVTLDTCTGCTRYDSSLEIRRNCLATGMADQVACDDDECRSSCAGGGRPVNSRITTSLAPGLYYVFVDGYGAFCGDYVLTATGL